MTARNAFEKLVTESAVGLIEGILKRLDERGARASTTFDPQRSLPYARTINDAMRVQVENPSGNHSIVYVGNSASSLNGAVIAPGLFTPSAVFMMDEREQQRIQSEQQFNQVRTERWRFS